MAAFRPRESLQETRRGQENMLGTRKLSSAYRTKTDACFCTSWGSKGSEDKRGRGGRFTGYLSQEI